MKTFTTRYGRKLSFDEQRWNLNTQTYTCQIIGEREEDYLLLDANTLVTWIPKATIRDNAFEVKGDEVTLSAGVYAKWISAPRDHASILHMQQLFEQYKELLFSQRQLILSHGEYYRLAPSLLKSSGAYMGGFSYSLGELVEAMEEKAPGVYFEEVAGYNALYLVSVTGSALSGVHNSLFWSDEKQQLIRITSSQCRLPGGFVSAIRSFKEAVNPNQKGFTYQDEALKQLLIELGVTV